MRGVIRMSSYSNNRLTCFAALCAIGLLLTFPIGAEEARQEAKPSGETPGPGTLAGIGRLLDDARMLPGPDRLGAAEKAARSLQALLESDIPKEKRCAVHFLSGEIHYTLGDYAKAAKEFKDAGKRDDERIYRDDAEAGYIMALEASGRDEEAAREWIKWEKKHPESPFVQEALTARAWNALRRGVPSEAERILAELSARFPWMSADARVIRAMATIAYIRGDYDETIALLSKIKQDAGMLYLAALSFEAKGMPLKAAAHYREVVERYPHSPLHDPAMIAKANIFLTSGSYKSAAEEMERVVAEASRPDIRGEAMLRKAVAIVLDGDAEEGTNQLRSVAAAHTGTDIAARAQFLLGEIPVSYTHLTLPTKRIV